MFRNLLVDLVGAPLLLPLVFAYLVGLVLAVASVVRSLTAGRRDAEERQRSSRDA